MMTYRAKLSLKFYMIAAVLFAAVLLGWYGISFLCSNEILLEDEVPMDRGTQNLLAVLMGLIVSTWTLSLLAVIRQGILGYAFLMDRKGIHATSTAMILLSLILVVPIKRIPYEAITRVFEERGCVGIEIDKSKVEVFPALRFLMRREYRFFAGFTKEKPEKIREELQRFVKG